MGVKNKIQLHGMKSGARHPPNPSTAERDRALLLEIADHDLPPLLAEVVDEYQELPYARPPFMWKWVHKLAPRNTLPCVDSRYSDDVPLDKTLTILFVTLLDDILEKGGDSATFQAATRIPYEDDITTFPAQVDEEYVRFTRRVWELLIDRIQRGPAFDTYAPLFHYDIGQAINAIEYTDLVNRRPELATMADLERYESHNMVMFGYADIDLMHSTTGIGNDHSTLRTAIWHAQLMARIGNWVSTWERELREGDISAGVVVYALENDVISQSDIRALRNGQLEADALIERIKAREVEAEFLTRWDEQYQKLWEINDELTTMDLTPFIKGMEEVLRYHLASTGLK